MKTLALVVVTLLIQRTFGMPGAPAWLAHLQLTTIWVVAPALRRHDSRWVFAAIALGLAWDLALDQPVLGPGGIAWSAAAVVVVALASVVADRSPKAWFAYGAVAAVTAPLVLELARLPLGLATAPTMVSMICCLLIFSLCSRWIGLVAMKVCRRLFGLFSSERATASMSP